MLFLSRAAVSVASFLCLFGAATISVPSFASETTASPAGSATAMLAAVTGPLLAVDIHTLEQRSPDFSSQGNPAQSNPLTQNGSTPSADAGSQASPIAPQSLTDLVADHATASADDEESNCLAASVYYESKGEPLSGQLAVAQTILNRTHSSRFPASVCGVVRQPGQFSFLHGGEIPTPKLNDAWQTAVAIAIIARQGLWKQIAPEALYFHARSVSPGWGKIRVASLGHHIFFR